jgi:hypothetical protein
MFSCQTGVVNVMLLSNKKKICLIQSLLHSIFGFCRKAMLLHDLDQDNFFQQSQKIAALIFDFEDIYSVPSLLHKAIFKIAPHNKASNT